MKEKNSTQLRGHVLVTGADGFIGQALCKSLSVTGYFVRRAVRTSLSAKGEEAYAVGEIGPATDWTAALDGVNCVVHLAARTHVIRERSRDPWGEFCRVNVVGTERLARMAAERGVRRLVYISSAGVNGNLTADRPFTEDDKPRPHNPYTLSKWEAEQRLHQVAQETELEVVVLRPPLVYGPGVKANFLSLIGLVNSGLPLPMGSIDNHRSLLYVGNLADAIIKCIDHPRAAGEIFLLSDGEDVSTPQLVDHIACSLEKPARVLPFPPSLIRAAGKISGKTRVGQLLGSLVVDSSKIRRVLGWQPPYTLTEGLKETALWFRDRE